MHKHTHHMKHFTLQTERGETWKRTKKWEKKKKQVQNGIKIYNLTEISCWCRKGHIISHSELDKIHEWASLKWKQKNEMHKKMNCGKLVHELFHKYYGTDKKNKTKTHLDIHWHHAALTLCSISELLSGCKWKDVTFDNNLLDIPMQK